MKFWDASAIVPLVVRQRASLQLRDVLASDAHMFVWWGTQIECASALTRLARSGVIEADATTAVFARLGELVENWQEIDPSEAVREAALRFLRVHPLRAADALQLAAAYLAADWRPRSLEFVTLDDRLAAAAEKEGFSVLDVPSTS